MQDAGSGGGRDSRLAMVRIMAAVMRGFLGTHIEGFSIFKKAQAALNFCSKHVLQSMGYSGKAVMKYTEKNN